MTTAVAKKENAAVAALAGLKRGVQNVRQAIPTSSTVPILRMGNDGVWIYGQENIEVEDSSRWAINPLSIQHGFVCWTNYAKEEKKKNELLGEVYAPMSAEPIDPAKLQDHGWPWKPATSVGLKCVSGEDEGEEVTYKPSSVGGANVMQALLTALEKQLDKGVSAIVPVVVLKNDHYLHKQYGKTYVPEFDIVDWMELDGDAPQPADEPEPDKDDEGGAAAEPEKETEDAKAPEEPDTGDEEPKTEGRTRRRRRSS